MKKKLSFWATKKTPTKELTEEEKHKQKKRQNIILTIAAGIMFIAMLIAGTMYHGPIKPYDSGNSTQQWQCQIYQDKIGNFQYARHPDDTHFIMVYSKINLTQDQINKLGITNEETLKYANATCIKKILVEYKG